MGAIQHCSVPGYYLQKTKAEVGSYILPSIRRRLRSLDPNEFLCRARRRQHPKRINHTCLTCTISMQLMHYLYSVSALSASIGELMFSRYPLQPSSFLSEYIVIPILSFVSFNSTNHLSILSYHPRQGLNSPVEKKQ
jgi:hypothetical protein